MLLAAEGPWRVSLACPGEGALPEAARRTGAEVHVVPQSPRLNRGRDALSGAGAIDKVLTALAILSYNIRFWRFLRRVRPEILQCHSMRNVLMVGLAAWAARVPLVLFVKGEMLSPLLDRAAMAMARRTLFLTGALKPARFRALFDRTPDRFPLLRLGIHFDEVDAAERRVRERSPEGVPPAAGLTTFAFAGSLVEAKGVHVLLEAFAHLARMRGDCRLVLAGTSDDDAYRRRCEATVADAGLQDRVIFLGWRDDVLDIMAAADVYVLPSFSEGVPRSIVEAMALGKPTVGTDVGGVPELLGGEEGGLVVAPGDAAALAGAMARLAADPELRGRLGTAARRAARQRHGFDAHLRGLGRILDSARTS
jgi:glycosyltransferase involved in cell wall biosynthesis